MVVFLQYTPKLSILTAAWLNSSRLQTNTLLGCKAYLSTISKPITLFSSTCSHGAFSISSTHQPMLNTSQKTHFHLETWLKFSNFFTIQIPQSYLKTNQDLAKQNSCSKPATSEPPQHPHHGTGAYLQGGNYATAVGSHMGLSVRAIQIVRLFRHPEMHCGWTWKNFEHFGICDIPMGSHELFCIMLSSCIPWLTSTRAQDQVP